MPLFNIENKKGENILNDLNIFPTENFTEFSDQNKNNTIINNINKNLNPKQQYKKKIFHVYESNSNSSSISSQDNKDENTKKFKCEHPGCNIRFRTMKLKVNRHDINDEECKIDTVYILKLVSEVKKILNKKNARKNKTKYNRLKNLYKKCIKCMPHKEYFINIVGDKL